jgi:hypothetical protein
MARNRLRLVFQKGADLLKEPIGSRSDTPGTNGFKRERRRTGRGNGGTRQGQKSVCLRDLVQGDARGASSGNWMTTASKGPCEMTSVLWPLPVVSSMSQAVESGGIACAGSDPNASGQTEEDLAGRRPVTFAAPADRQLKQNEAQRRRRLGHWKRLRGRGKQSHFAFDLKRVEAA